MSPRFVALVVLLSSCGAATTTDCSTMTDTWSGYGATFFASNCSTCHQHTGQYGTQSSVVSAISQIESEVSAGKMPQGTTLSTTDKTRLLNYLSCGAP